MAETEVAIEGNNPSDNARGELPEGILPKTTGKRGRPLGSKNRSTPLDTGSGEEKRPVSGASVNATESAKFIGVGLVAIMELAESFIHNSCGAKIEKRFPHKLVEFKQMAATLGLQEKDKQLMAESAEKIAAKYNVLNTYGPEIVLGVMLAQYGMRQITLIKFVENVTRVKPQENVATESVETGAPKV